MRRDFIDADSIGSRTFFLIVATVFLGGMAALNAGAAVPEISFAAHFKAQKAQFDRDQDDDQELSLRDLLEEEEEAEEEVEADEDSSTDSLLDLGDEEDDEMDDEAKTMATKKTKL